MRFPSNKLDTTKLRAIYVSIAVFISSNVSVVHANEESNRSKLDFRGITAPVTDKEKRKVRATPQVVAYGDIHSIGFENLIRSGETLGKEVFGLLFDADGLPLVNRDESLSVSNANDFSSLLQNDEGLFMVSQFESRPGGVYLSDLHQDLKTGKLSVKKTRPLDLSPIHGGWLHCAGSVTPWNTHLGGEEYPPDASWVDPKTGDGGSYYNYQARYFDNDLKKLNPYFYGYQFEVDVKNFDQAKITKHYAMGRIGHELGLVMPNQKTVYLSDDDTNAILLRFEADHAGDLSAGELFAARWHQTSAKNGGQAKLTWISLGHADNKTIEGLIDKKTTFTNIFETGERDEFGACIDEDFTPTNTVKQQECLKIRPKMELAASRLETRRYAAIKGATTEFRKMEGMTFDPKHRELYLSLSSIHRGMLDDHSKYDFGGSNHIRLAKNKCGGIYRLKLDENYVAQSMTAELMGTPVHRSFGAKDNRKSYPSDSPLARNKCHVDNIANPDNLSLAVDERVLFIGEDSGSGHQNDAVWAYNLDTKKLTRLLTTPYGSETTSIYHYPNINGWSYLMTVVQHPYGESDQDKSKGNGDTAAYTGYIGPWPAKKRD